MLSTRGIVKHKRIYVLAKSNRINALRKQYDAFLEEDKKRKERNDFILGRLENMRYSTTLVPVRHKPSVFATHSAVVGHLGLQPEFSSVRDIQSSSTNPRQLLPHVQVSSDEDKYLIQEISKKYILIPKLSTTYMNNCIRDATTNQTPERLQEIHRSQVTVPIKDLNTEDPTDWKNKYEILNILKNEEKEKPTRNYDTGFQDIKQSVPKVSLDNNQGQVVFNSINYVNTDVDFETPTKYDNELPEKDLPAETLHFDTPEDEEYVHNVTLRASGDLTSENNNSFKANYDKTDDIGDQLRNITLEYKHSDAPSIDISQEVLSYHEPQSEPDDKMIPNIAQVCSPQSVHNNEENVNVQPTYTVEAGSLEHDQNMSAEQQEHTGSEQVVYVEAKEENPIQNLNYNSPSTLDVNDRTFENENSVQFSNDQEFASNISVQMKTDATDISKEQTYIDNSIDTVEHAEPVIEQMENQVNISESIEDFDAEQRDMFYTEQVDENYPTQQSDVEHPMDFTQNEYAHNQEYAYYENTEAGAYPAQSHDEEVTQQYDPSYEQQYTGLDQASEQQQYVEHYEEPERLTEQVEPEFEVLQYEQQFESQGEIEKTLDVEDGYTAQISEAPAVEEPIITEKSDDNVAPVIST